MIFTADSCPPLAPPPDDLTLPQFMLDAHHPLRQVRTGELNTAPWLIESESGKSTWAFYFVQSKQKCLHSGWGFADGFFLAYGYEELRDRTFALANGIASRWAVGE